MTQQQPPVSMLPRQGFLEKKGTLGMYSKKFCTFNPMTLEFVCADKEGAKEHIFASQLKQILIHDEDNQVLNFVGSKPGETILLKGQTYMIAGSWYNFVYQALEKRNIVRPRHGYLPKLDPRFNAPFLKNIPEEYITRFTKLEHSVLYWFGEVKKYEAASLGKKPNLEDRIVFLSDKCLYVTTKTGQVTMCCKVHEIETVFTNLTLKKAETGGKKLDHFIVLKFKNYDVHLQGHHLRQLVQVISAVYNHHHGYKTLDIKESESALDGAVKLNINPDLKMAMVLPTPKHQLKKALDQFAAKHGIAFEEDDGTDDAANNNNNEQSTHTSAGASPSGIKAVTSSASPAKSSSGNFMSSTDAIPGGSTSTEKELPYTDPLACFLSNMDLGSKYYFKLVDQGVDLDCLEVMDNDDLKNFGIPEGPELNLLKYKLSKEDIIQEAREQAEQVQKGKKWLRSEMDDPNAPSLPSRQPSTVAASSPPPPKPSATTSSKGGGLLDDSDEDDLLPRKPSVPPAAKKSSSNVLFDSDSDDDFDLDDLILKPKPVSAGGAGGAGGFKGKITLDSDSDDLGLGLSPKQSSANLKPSSSATVAPKKSIDLLDDDDI